MTFSCMIKDGSIGKSLINLRAYDIVLFDLDGTIAETEAIGHLPAFNCAFATHKMNWTWDSSQYRELLKITGGHERLKAYRAMLESTGQLKDYHSDEFLKQVHQRKNKIYARLMSTGIVEPRKGFFSLIKKIWHLNRQWGVVTTTSQSNWDSLWNNSIKGRVDIEPKIIVCGEKVERKKPDPEAYILAARQLNIPPSKCLVIEDSDNGAKAAHAAGMDFIGVRSHFFANDHLDNAKVIVEELSHIEFELSNLY